MAEKDEVKQGDSDNSDKQPKTTVERTEKDDLLRNSGATQQDVVDTTRQKRDQDAEAFDRTAGALGIKTSTALVDGKLERKDTQPTPVAAGTEPQVQLQGLIRSHLAVARGRSDSSTLVGGAPADVPGNPPDQKTEPPKPAGPEQPAARTPADDLTPDQRRRVNDRWLNRDNEYPLDQPPADAPFSERAAAEARARTKADWDARLQTEIAGQAYNPDRPSTWRKDYNPESVKIFTEMMGGGPLDRVLASHEITDKPEGGYMSEQGRNAYYVRQFLRAKTDEDRQAAMRGLEQEVLGGNNAYALKVLQALALTDATRQLREAKSPDEQKEALKKLAGIEFGQGDTDAKKYRDSLLQRFPDGDEQTRAAEERMAPAERTARQEARRRMVETATSEAGQQTMGTRSAADTATLDAVTGDSRTRKQAIVDLEQRSRELLLSGDESNASALKQTLEKAKAADAIQDIGEAKDPKAAAEALQRLTQMAKDGNGEALRYFTDQVREPEKLLADLTSPDPEKQRAAMDSLRQQNQPAAEHYQDYRRKSANDILTEFAERDPEKVREAREKAAEFAQQNFKEADVELEKYLDRGATQEQREAALKGLEEKDAERVRTLRSDSHNPILHAVRAADMSRNLHDATTAATELFENGRNEDRPDSDFHDAAAKVKEQLEGLVRASNDPEKGNLYAGQYLAKFKPGEVDQLIKDLGDNENPEKQLAAFKKISETVDKPDAMLDELRTGRIVRHLDGTSKAEDYEKAVAALKDESEKHGNKTAAEWLEWARPAKALADMREAKEVSTVSKAVDELSQMARDGNPNARRALAAFLIADQDKGVQAEWVRNRNASVEGKPTYVPDLTTLERTNPAAYHEVKMAALKALTDSTGAEPKAQLAKGEAAAVALAMSANFDHAQSGSMTAERADEFNKAGAELLKRVIAEKSKGERGAESQSEASSQTMRALREVLTSDMKGREALVETYLTGAKLRDFGTDFDKLETKGIAGDRASIAIMAATSSGISDVYGLSTRAARTLDTAAVDTDQRKIVSDELVKAFNKYGDTDQLLRTLGSVTQREGTISDEVSATFKKGVESSDKRTHNSAVDGLMRCAESWSEKELDIVRQNLTPEMIKAVGEAGDRIPADLRSKLIAECMEKANPSRKIDSNSSAAEDLQSRITALRTITALGKFVTPEQALQISRMGESQGQQLTDPVFKDSPGKKGLMDLGFNEAHATRLQREAGLATLSILARAEDEKARDTAYQAIGKLGWGTLFSGTEARDALVKYLEGKGTIPLDKYDELSKLVYDANLPVPAAAVLRSIKPGHPDSEYYDAVKEIATHYGGDNKNADDFIRKTTANAALWNSLEGWQRRDMTGSDRELPSGTKHEIIKDNIDARVYNALPPEVRQALSGNPRALGPGESPPDLSNKSIDAATFNRLSPELRRQLTGNSANVDMVQLFGVMRTGGVAEKYPQLAANGVDGKSLDKAVADRATAADSAAVKAAQSQQRVEASKREELRALCEMTKQGPDFSDKAEHVIRLWGLIGTSPLDEWDKKQSQSVRTIRGLEGQSDALAQVVAENSQKREFLRFAASIGDYQANLNNGQRRQADDIAVRMLRDYGPDMMRAYAADAYRNLTQRDGEGNFGRSGLMRMADMGGGTIREFPNYSQDPTKRFGEGVTALTTGWPKDARWGADVEAYRNAALKAIDADPALNAFADVGRTMNRNMEPLTKMVQAAAEGTKYQTFVDDARARAHEMKDAISKVTPGDVAAAKGRLDELRASLPNITDDKARAAVQDKIKAVEEMLKVADPASPERKQIEKMLEQVLSRDFDADTAGKWLRENAVVIGVTIAAAAITVASMGTASPLAVILVTSAVCVGVSQATKEGLYLLNHYVADTGLGKWSERSHLGAWTAATYEKAKNLFSTFGDHSTGENAENFAKFMADAYLSFQKDVTLPLTLEYFTNVAMGIACFGLGQLGAQGLKGVAPSTFRSALVSKPGAELAAQMEAATAAGARSEAGKTFLREWMGKFAKESASNLKFTVAQEATGQAAEAAMARQIGKGNPWLAFGVTGALALAQGRMGRNRLRVMEEGRGVEIPPELEATMLKQCKTDGHSVKEIAPGRYEVRPYNAPPGEPPILMTVGRGDGQPARNLSPDGKPMVREERASLPTEVKVAEGVTWKETPATQRAMNDIGTMTDHMAAGRYEQVVDTAKASGAKVQEHNAPFDLDTYRAKPGEQTAMMDAYLKDMGKIGKASETGDGMTLPRPTMKVNGVEVDLVTGKAVGGSKDPAAIARAEAEVGTFRSSEAGQRILAERAVIAMEEGVHVRQGQTGEVLSPSYAEFSRQMKSPEEQATAMDPKKRTKDQLEQEVILALHDKGWSLDQLRHHFGNHHTEARADAFRFIEAQQQLRKVPELKAAYEERLAKASPAEKAQILEEIKAGAPAAKKILDMPELTGDLRTKALEHMRDAVSEGTLHTKGQSLETLLKVAAKHPDLAIDVPALMKKHVPPEVVAQYAELANRFDAIGSAKMTPKQIQDFQNLVRSRLAEANAHASDANRSPGQHAEQARALRDMNRVLDVINNPAALARVDSKTLDTMPSLLESSKRNPDLHVPFETLLGAGVNPNAVKRYADLAAQYADVVRPGSSEYGHQHEHQTGNRVMELLEHEGLRTGPNGERENWMFVPAEHNSTADGMGIDGVFINAKTGEVIFADMAQSQGAANNKVTKDGKMFGVCIDDTYAPRSDADVRQAMTSFISGSSGPPRVVGQRSQQVIDDGRGGKRTWTTDDFHDVVGQASPTTKLEFPSFNQVRTDVEAQRAGRDRRTTLDETAELKNAYQRLLSPNEVRIIDELGSRDPRTLTGQEKSDLANARKNPFAQMYEGARASFYQRRSENFLATRMTEPIQAAVDVRRAGNGDTLNPNPPFTTGHDTSKNPPVRFVEFQLEGGGISVGRNNITTLRVYEDGMVAGRETFDNNGTPKTTDVQLGNLHDMMATLTSKNGKLPEGAEFARQFECMTPAERAQLAADMQAAQANPTDPAVRQKLYDKYPALRVIGQCATEGAKVRQAGVDAKREIATQERNTQLESVVGVPQAEARSPAFRREIEAARTRVGGSNELGLALLRMEAANPGSSGKSPMDAARKLRTEADKLVKSDKITFSEAVDRVLLSRAKVDPKDIPDFARDWQKARLETPNVTLDQVKEMRAARVANADMGTFAHVWNGTMKANPRANAQLADAFASPFVQANQFANQHGLPVDAARAAYTDFVAHLEATGKTAVLKDPKKFAAELYDYADLQSTTRGGKESEMWFEIAASAEKLK